MNNKEIKLIISFNNNFFLNLIPGPLSQWNLFQLIYDLSLAITYICSQFLIINFSIII